MAEHGSKVGDAERTEIEAAIAAMKEALTGDDAEAIQARSQALAQASMKLGEAMYKASQEDSSGNQDGGPASGSGEDVVDADFEEIQEDERKRSA
jgi:molecular chaperone DnaK